LWFPNMMHIIFHTISCDLDRFVWFRIDPYNLLSDLFLLVSRIDTVLTTSIGLARLI
jgi:hypothetical protein